MTGGLVPPELERVVPKATLRGGFFYDDLSS